MRRGILGLVCVMTLVAGLTGTAQAASYDNDTVIVKFARDLSNAQRLALFDATGVRRRVGAVGPASAPRWSGSRAIRPRWRGGSTGACSSPTPSPTSS